MLTRLTLVGTAVLLAASAMAQNENAGTRTRDSSTLDVLNQSIPEFTAQDASLREVIDILGLVAPNANIEVRWTVLQDAGVDPEKQNITLKLKGPRLSQVLREVMQQAGGTDLQLAYRAVGKSIIISTQKDLGGEMVSKVYDLRDLLAGTAFFQAPQMDPSQNMNNSSGGGGGGGSGNLFQNQNRAQNQSATSSGDGGPEMVKILKIITETIQPDSWSTGGGKGTIHPFNGVIVVYNSPLVHQQIAGFVEEEGLSH